MRLQTTPLLLEPVEEKAVTAPWDSCARQSPDLVPEAPSWDVAEGSTGPGRCLRGWAVAEKNIGRAGPRGVYDWDAVHLLDEDKTTQCPVKANPSKKTDKLTTSSVQKHRIKDEQEKDAHLPLSEL